MNAIMSDNEPSSTETPKLGNPKTLCYSNSLKAFGKPAEKEGLKVKFCNIDEKSVIKRDKDTITEESNDSDDSDDSNTETEYDFSPTNKFENKADSYEFEEEDADKSFDEKTELSSDNSSSNCEDKDIQKAQFDSITKKSQDSESSITSTKKVQETKLIHKIDKKLDEKLIKDVEFKSQKKIADAVLPDTTASYKNNPKQFQSINIQPKIITVNKVNVVSVNPSRNSLSFNANDPHFTSESELNQDDNMSLVRSSKLRNEFPIESINDNNEGSKTPKTFQPKKKSIIDENLILNKKTLSPVIEIREKRRLIKDKSIIKARPNNSVVVQKNQNFIDMVDSVQTKNHP